MGTKNDCRKNAEGYSDPTAYEALSKKRTGSTNYWIPFLHFVNCPTSILKNESSSRINELDEFGGEYLCLTEFEKHSAQSVFIERFALIRIHISGIWKHW